MYTWGYLKNSILSKLDLDEEEAIRMNYFERFVYYANEAMTMICSTVKPKRSFYEITIDSNNVNSFITMPNDFISFGDDVNTIIEDIGYGTTLERDATDEDLAYVGYNQISCKTKGKFLISYNGRWVTFSREANDTVLNVPTDILECIPSYVASQCLKVDDEYKSSVFRNEFEILFARIDDTNYKANKTFSIGGDW